jgi:hypothetical protein
MGKAVSPRRAAVLSLLLPGLGHEALGLRRRALAWCAVLAAAALIVFSRPGAPAWGLLLPPALRLAGTWDAWRLARERSKPRVRQPSALPCAIFGPLRRERAPAGPRNFCVPAGAFPAAGSESRRQCTLP